MTEAEDLRAFTVALLRDAGAEVREDGTFLWATIPDSAQTALDLPSQACVTFDPDRIGEFDAELVAPGSYLLEKLLGLATRRGRWDVARLQGRSDAWIEEGLRASAGVSARGPIEVLERKDEPLALFTFRTALTSDEKREAFHLIAATLDGGEGWAVSWPLDESGLTALGLPALAPDLDAAYRRAQAILHERMREELDSFQRTTLAALEEEVRRIFRYFDGTVAEVRDAEPSHADDTIRAIEAERDRRLAEALERFEPHAVASLCSVRVVIVPKVRVSIRKEGAGRVEMCLDALTKHVRGPS